jgi:hypothetical protein
MHVTVRNSKISFFVYVNIQQEPNISGSEREKRTLYQPYIYILPTLRPSWANVRQNLVGIGGEGKPSLLEVADSELCTASHKSDCYSGNSSVKLYSTVGMTLVMVVHDSEVINA